MEVLIALGVLVIQCVVHDRTPTPLRVPLVAESIVSTKRPPLRPHVHAAWLPVLVAGGICASQIVLALTIFARSRMAQAFMQNLRGLVAGAVPAFIPSGIALSGFIVLLLLFVAACIVWGAYRFRPCNHRALLCIEGWIVGASGAAANAAHDNPELILYAWPQLAGVMTSTGCISGVFFLLVWSIDRWITGARVDQDGRRCPHCSYIVDLGFQRRCSECGALLSAAAVTTTANMASEWRRSLAVSAVLLTFAVALQSYTVLL